MERTRLSPAHVLLGFLYQNPDHGYELHRRLCDEFGYTWHVSQSQTYNILKRLENQGLIRSRTITQEKLPPRQQHSLTDQGSRQFMDWLMAPTSCSVHAIRVEFITRLYFIQLYFPARSVEIINQQTEAVRLGLERLNGIRRDLPDGHIYNRLSLELRIKLLDSIQTWLDFCHQELTPRDSHSDEN